MIYKTLAGWESFGGSGEMGLRIEIAGSNLPDLKNQDLMWNTRVALKKIEDDIIALIKASDPKEQERSKLERIEILGCFDTPIYVETIPNGYCSDGCCRHLPWFIVTTNVGRFKIGWRKRVISIDWSDTKKTKRAEELFQDEDTTKGERDIHAWSYEKAKAYIKTVIDCVEV